MIDCQLKSYKLINKWSLSKAFICQHVHDFHSAIHHINDLPYGRNAARDDYTLVLEEKRGTCSTKHALLKALADEINLELELLVGIFLFTAKTHPRAEPILNAYNIAAIPEAHCYLQFHEQAFDITFPGIVADPRNLKCIHEETIQPHHIGEYKQQLHQRFIKRWLKNSPVSIDFDTIWQCREACIKRLSESYKS